MIEMIIAFVFGYLWSRVTMSRTHVDLRSADRILMWDQNCLGWRPVMTQNEIKPDAVYLAAFELNSLPAKIE
tara:strand:+ start:870 stop:1085 length:216 start_codon:yes stop_codon:yes gene_type:complete